MKKTYKNRYGDTFTFTLQEDGNVMWEGNFKYCRFGMPNDYTKAYKQYIDDNLHLDILLTREQFEEAGMIVGDPSVELFSNEVAANGTVVAAVGGSSWITTLVAGRVR